MKATNKEEEAQPVIIGWEDCCYNSGTTYTEDELLEFGLANLQTIGWGIEKEDRWILYAQHELDEKTYRHIICIPKTGIKKVTYLKETEAVNREV